MGLRCKECDTKITFKMVEKRNKGFFCYCDGCEKDKYSFQVLEYKSILRLTDEDECPKLMKQSLNQYY